jgi:hypothetical protein
MPQATAIALQGLGVSAQLAELMGAQPAITAGVGTAQTGAGLIKTKSVEVTAASSQTAVVFNSGAGINEPHFVFNSTSTTALVFVPAGHTLNGTLNNSLSVAQNKAAYFWQYKAKFWASVLTN